MSSENNLNNEINNQILEENHPMDKLNKVTPLSKYLALTLFIALPFIGAYVGYKSAPEKVVEKVVLEEAPLETKEETNVSDHFSLNKGFVATTTVDMGEYEVRYDQSILEVLNERYEVVQAIDVNFAGLAGFTDKDSLLITNRDINYDHYLDLGILESVGYSGVNRFYHFYIYNPETGLLELSDDFSTFEPDLSNLVNPTFDIENKSIISSIKSGQEWRYVEYQFDGNKYTQSREWVEFWSDDRSELDRLLRLQNSVVQICETQDVLSCFGSGRTVLPELQTDTYTVYALVSSDQITRYGLINRRTGILSELLIYLED